MLRSQVGILAETWAETPAWTRERGGRVPVGGRRAGRLKLSDVSIEHFSDRHGRLCSLIGKVGATVPCRAVGS